MGRGLAAILPETPDQASDLRQLPVELIRPNPDQPRTRFDPESISALAHSIATAGVVQPLIVRPLAERQLRARRRRAPLARRPARPGSPRSRRSSATRASPSACRRR